jgi:hypothetical protein
MMGALKFVWVTLVTATFGILLLYLYIGSNISISIKFTVRPKDSVINSIFNTSKYKGLKPPKPIMNIKKFQRKRNSTTTTQAPSTSSTTTKPSTTQKVMTSTTQKVMTSTTQKVMTSTTQNVMTSTTQNVTMSTAQKVMTSNTQNVMTSTTQNVMTSTTQKVMTSTAKPVTSTANSVTTANPHQSTTEKHKSKQISAEVKRVVSRKISPDEKKLLMDLMSQFVILADRLNLTYIMFGGTLLGSWRHHAMIPWDDDFDVLVNETQKPQLLAEIKKLEPNYLGPDTAPVIKFYSNKSRKIPGRKWLWPFMTMEKYFGILLSIFPV